MEMEKYAIELERENARLRADLQEADLRIKTLEEDWEYLSKRVETLTWLLHKAESK